MLAGLVRPGEVEGSGFAAITLSDQRAIQIASVACRVPAGATLLPSPAVLAERFLANNNAVTVNGDEVGTVTSRGSSKSEGHVWLVVGGGTSRLLSPYGSARITRWRPIKQAVYKLSQYRPGLRCLTQTPPGRRRLPPCGRWDDLAC